MEGDNAQGLIGIGIVVILPLEIRKVSLQIIAHKVSQYIGYRRQKIGSVKFKLIVLIRHGYDYPPVPNPA